MRGPRGINYRNNPKFQMPSEATARPYSHPCPYGGWNARGNLANMRFTDAIQMDNIFPGVQQVELRSGMVEHKTGFAADIDTLITYSSAAGDQLFAATDGGIYDATTAGAVGAAVAACTEGFYSFVNFSNAAGQWLALCNGVDAYKTYDGSSWATPAITGVSGADLNYVTAHQKRLWFIEKDSMNVWYLGVEAISGAATQYPLGALFKRGGYLVAIGSWTIDSGNGQDDFFVAVTSNGEIAVYQGTDPSSSSTWALVGVYSVARPLGPRPLLDYGGDLLYLSRTGLLPLTKIAQSAILDRTQEISYQIDAAMLEAAGDYADNFGWQMTAFRGQNALIVNVPVSDEVSYQFVMNTITKAWCRFTAWNARSWTVLGDNAYFAEARQVMKAWTGTTDNGAPIVGAVAQAYAALGISGQKNVKLARLNFSLSANLTLQMALDADFKTFGGQTLLNYAPSDGLDLWDTGLWDTAVWNSGETAIEPKWTTIPNDLGYLHSLRLTVTTSSSSWTWTSTDFAVQPAGIL